MIITGVFRRLGTEWFGYKAEVHNFLEDGDNVASKSTRAEFAHLYVLKDGKIQSMTRQWIPSDSGKLPGLGSRGHPAGGRGIGFGSNISNIEGFHVTLNSLHFRKNHQTK